MMVFLQNSCQQVEGNTIYGHPGGQIPDFLYQKLPQTLLLLSYVYFCGQCALSDGPNRQVFWHNNIIWGYLWSKFGYSIPG